MTTPDSNPATKPAEEKLVFPWQPGYTPGINIAPIITDILTPAPAPSEPPTAAKPAVAGNLTSALEQAVLTAAEQAARASLPAIEKEVLTLVVGSVSNGIGSIVPKPAAPVITSDVFTKSAARSRAFRTFITGLGLAGFWGIITALGTLNGADFFTKNGLVSIATILVTSVVSSAVAYIARIKVEPNYVSQLPPSGKPTG